jgi:hypothetical protein
MTKDLENVVYFSKKTLWDKLSDGDLIKMLVFHLKKDGYIMNAENPWMVRSKLVSFCTNHMLSPFQLHQTNYLLDQCSPNNRLIVNQDECYNFDVNLIRICLSAITLTSLEDLRWDKWPDFYEK